MMVPDVHKPRHARQKFPVTTGKRTREPLLFLLIAGIIWSVEILHVTIVVLLPDEPLVTLLIGAVKR